ncbi:hypothetical protein [Mycobacterium alsense]|uniref:hypothetical protein n=1 Tax=Mycobacterium alsense TaxID=324058 RepID=UPI000E76B8D9|nr:hypothetical protein [Mycobacterium alsense]
MATLTPYDVKRWDLAAIQMVFETANGRANTLQRLGDNLQQVHDTLSDWHGEAGEAFRADLGKARRDIEADGQESRQVAAAVSRAEGDVSACKRELADIERAADAKGWTITPDWRIDVGDTWIGRDPIELAAQRQLLQDRLIMLKVRTDAADHELAAAIRAAVGEAPVASGGPPPGGSPPPQGARGPAPSGKPRMWQDMLLPDGPADAGPSGGPPTGVPNPAGGVGGKPPSLQDLLTGGPPNSDPQLQPGGLPGLLGLAGRPGAPGAPALRPTPADVESARALLRPIMLQDGVPPDQIEARLDQIVAGAQQWIDHGMPNYIPPEPTPPPPPGFGEGFADRWFATEQGIKNLLGQGGPGAPGVLESWQQMLKGTVETATNPVGTAVGEVKNLLDSPSPAYYAGGKTADGAFALPGLLFGGEGAAVSRAGELSDLDAAASLPHDLPGMHPPLDTGDHLPAGTGDHHYLWPTDHPSWDEPHHGPFLVDSSGHYIPGTLPSYGELQQLTSTDPNTAFYWSGRNAAGIGVGPDGSGVAEQIAHGSGGTTLEMLLAKNGVDPLPVWNRHDPVSVKFWDDASAAYAENTRGEVTAVIGRDLRPGNVWESVEIPRLIDNPNVSRIVQIDPDTGEATTLFERGK